MLEATIRMERLAKTLVNIKTIMPDTASEVSRRSPSNDEQCHHNLV
jgi:hypothetical protein